MSSFTSQQIRKDGCNGEARYALPVIDIKTLDKNPLMILKTKT
ncbi:MAG: hypothetical protein ABDH21_01280 [bacterium]